MSDAYSQIIQDVHNDRRLAAGAVVGNIDNSPDDAQRALELSHATGVPAPVINGDLETFERNNKAQMAGDIVRSNNYIADYINSHPLAAQLSHDDVGNLDEASESMRPLIQKGFIENTLDVLKSAYEGVTLPTQHQEIYQNTKAYLLKQGFDEKMAEARAQHIGEGAARQEWLENLLFAIPTAIASPVIGAFRTYGSQPLEKATGIPQEVTENFTMIALAAAPWLRAGKSAPMGVHPEIDKAKIEKSDVELGQLMDALKASQSSLTRERNPDMYAEFARQHVGDQSIGIHSDALRELYGEKAPEPDDGIIGFIPNAAEKLATAEASGGYVDVPTADFLAKVDPEVAKELEEFIRPRPDGVSKAEAKAMVEAYHGSPHSFEAFSNEAIGTGEGAQSYGYGHYVAENPEVAEQYAKMGVQFVDKDGNKLPTGNTYRVRIHRNPEEFLDWDKPLGEQSSEIQAKLVPFLEKRLGELGPDETTLAMRDVAKQLEVAELPAKTAQQLHGSEAYRTIHDNDREASRLLSEAGIPGIRYLDQGSRNAQLALSKSRHPEDLVAPKPTYNYVIFDPKDLEITHRNDEAITSVRQAAGTETSAKAMAEVLNIQPPERGYIYTTADGSEIRVVPTDVMTAAERDVAALAEQTINRIVGKGIDLKPADQITFSGTRTDIQGINVSTEGLAPVIAYTINSAKAPRIVRHEAIHQLINWGLLTPEELATVSQAALTKNAAGKDWLDKHQIRERYAEHGMDEAALIEEAFAEEFGEWGALHEKADQQVAAYGQQVSAVFEKVFQFFDQLYARLEQYFGHPPTVTELFNKIESGEVAKRAQATGEAQAKAAEPELPGVTRMEDRAAFEAANAIGMTKDQYRRYMKLIGDRQKEDLEAAAKRALEEQRKKQTVEWKKNRAELRPQVVDQLNERPDIAAQKLLGQGELFGDKVEPVRLGEDYLTPAQREALPKSWVTKRGANPSDIAALTGHPSGDAMIESLAGLEAQRKASGLNPSNFFRRLVDAETDRQMEAKHGKLGDQILQEAKEQVLSETQLDLLHEETLAMGLKAGAEFSITKDQMKKWAEDRFRALDAKDIDSDKFIADAGRAGRAAEDALLKGDPAEGFRQRQRQYISALYAKSALAFEKEKAGFTKTAERLTRREVKNVDKDFINWAQNMLAKAGYNIKRNLNELADSLDRSSYSSFEEFVQSKVGDGWELTIQPDILREAQGPLEKMSVEQFLDFKDALDQMYHVGREAKKIAVGGQKQDFEDFKAQVLDNIRSLPPRNKAKPVRWLFQADAAHVRMEEMLKDLDLRKELGPLFNALVWPMSDAKHSEYSMLEKLSKRLTELKGDKEWIRSLSDTIPQNFFTDPYDGTLFDMSREHMIQIMLNFGNRSNIEKFTKGYAGKDKALELEAQLWNMIHSHATKADWDFVQSIWDLFDDWKKQSADMYYDLSGRQPKWIDPTPVTTKHGVYAGGYYPVIYDRLRSNINAIEDKVAPNAMFGSNYFRASPANHYAKDRTGYVDRVQFETSIEQVAGRMQQMIHDISYRRAVMDAGKVIYDREIRQAIRKHYGEEYEAQLSPWLKDIANHFNSDELANSWASATMRRARWNLMGHALGLNLKVILSPSVAKANPMDAMRVYTNYAESSKLAYEKSREIPHTFRNIDRDFRERLEQTISKGGLDKFQADAVRWAFMPTVKVEQQFRIITFVNEYQKGIAKGMSEGEAAANADSLVRERHGSSGLPDLPAIMRGSEALKISTMFYGYFSGMYNWQRQISGNVKRGEWNQGLQNIWGAVAVPAAFGALFFNNSKEGDSWGKMIGKALLLQPLSTLVFAREFANFFIEGNPARSPLATLTATLSSMVTDIKNFEQGKKVQRPIQHAGNVVGLATGLPMAQVARTSQFAYDVNKGAQRPRNIIEWVRGIVTGQSRLKK